MRHTLLLLAALAAVPTTAASGQPALLYSDPGQGEMTRGMPTAVRLRFTQPMRLDRLQVFDSEGTEVVVRRNRDAAKPSLEQRGGLPRLRPGDHRVEWTASSGAGQSISGTLFFKAVERQE